MTPVDDLYETEINGSRVVVQKIKPVVVRVGATLKFSGVEYRSLHDGEESVRSEGEFDRMFKPCGRGS
jgi:hypothetical protein